MVCWMSETSSLPPGAKLAIKHTTRSARAMVKDLQYRLDVNTLHRDDEADQLCAQRDRPGAACAPPCRSSTTSTAATATTGSFILIDEGNNTTVGAGMILGPTQ